jgi:hypothetical protein
MRQPPPIVSIRLISGGGPNEVAEGEFSRLWE